MKRITAAFLALCLLLCGCRRIFPNEYIRLSEHNAPYAYKGDTAEKPTQAVRSPVVSDYYALRSVLMGYVTSGTEHGQVRMEKYRGEPEQDLKRVKTYLTEEEPICAYAINYITLEQKPTEEGWLVSVDAVYRRSVRQIESIIFVRGNDAADETLHDALTQFQNTVTVRISGYTEEDFVQSLTDYCKQHPDQVGVIPAISASVYPDSGNVRVAEVSFRYPTDSQTLKTMRSDTDSVLSSVYSYIRYTEDDSEKLQLIYSYLSSRFPYREDRQNASFYSLLCEGVGSSVCYAAVVNYLCGRVGLDCRIVSGTLAGEPHDWNIVALNGAYYHYDFHEAALQGAPPQPLTDAQMTEYAWNTEEYPACPGTEPTE